MSVVDRADVCQCGNYDSLRPELPPEPPVIPRFGYSSSSGHLCLVFVFAGAPSAFIAAAAAAVTASASVRAARWRPSFRCAPPSCPIRIRPVDRMGSCVWTAASCGPSCIPDVPRQGVDDAPSVVLGHFAVLRRRSHNCRHQLRRLQSHFGPDVLVVTGALLLASCFFFWSRFAALGGSEPTHRMPFAIPK